VWVGLDTWDVSRTTLLGKRALDVSVSSIALVTLLPLLVSTLSSSASRAAGGHCSRNLGRAATESRFGCSSSARCVATQRSGWRKSSTHEALDEPALKIADDPRKTPVGRFLRRSSINELPQR
jgi:lipopolysaccharide/colanic/teichoic acid biosynthesis glycosyltransferase